MHVACPILLQDSAKIASVPGVASTIGGTVQAGYERVRDAFADGHAEYPGGGQLCIYLRGEPVVDLWASGEDPLFSGDSVSVIWSSTKGVLALCMALLVEHGVLDVDAPVTRYWPEFGSNGKSGATTAHLLAHTVGLPEFPSASGIRAEDLVDRERCIRILAEAPPLWEPGATRGLYHTVTYGFLVSEVLRRITGQTEGAFLAENITGPLGLDLWIGLPAEQESRFRPHAGWTASSEPVAGHPSVETLLGEMAKAGVDVDDPIVGEVLAGLAPIFEISDLLNTRDGRAAQIPGANGIANARALAKLYAAAIGEIDGIRLVSPTTIELFRASRLRDLPPVPAYAGVTPTSGDRGLGFALGEPGNATLPTGAFGHPGAGGVHGWADPEREIAVGYTGTHMYQGDPTTDPRTGWARALADLVPHPAR